MTLNNFKTELKNWRFTKYKAINFAIGILALLIYEFVGRPIYRPYIYNNKINDFHIADTLGNTFGTLPTIFFLIAILSNDTTKGNYLIKLGTLSVVVFELIHPLLGKSIDIWDIIATILTGLVSYLIYNRIFKDKLNEQKTTNR
jgi:glycopeptide antibiotics resistance protein